MTKRIKNYTHDIDWYNLDGKPLTAVLFKFKEYIDIYGEDTVLVVDQNPSGYDIRFDSFRDETPAEKKRRLKVEETTALVAKRNKTQQAERQEKEERKLYDKLKKKFEK